MKQLRLHYLSTGEAAAQLGCSRRTIVRYMEDGSLPFIRWKPGGWRFIRRHDFELFKSRKEADKADKADKLRA